MRQKLNCQSTRIRNPLPATRTDYNIGLLFVNVPLHPKVRRTWPSGPEPAYRQAGAHFWMERHILIKTAAADAGAVGQETRCVLVWICTGRQYRVVPPRLQDWQLES